MTKTFPVYYFSLDRKHHEIFVMLIFDDLPSYNSSILYALFGYDSCYIGESGDGIERTFSTQNDKPWVSGFLWFDLSEWACEKTDDRKHLEALVINRFGKFIESDRGGASKITLRNSKFVKTLGKFESRPKTRAIQRLEKYAFKVFLEHMYENPDPRGNFVSYIEQFESGPLNHTPNLFKHLKILCGNSPPSINVSYKKISVPSRMIT